MISDAKVKIARDLDIALASPFLRLFFIENQLNTKRSDYNMVSSRTITGNLDIKKLESSLKKIINESFILGSHLYLDGEDKLYWKKNIEVASLLHFNDISQKENFIKIPFDLLKGPLYRGALFKIGEKKYNLIIILHHIVIDGSCIDIMLDRIAGYYNGEDLELFSSLEEQKFEIQKSSEALTKRIEFLYEDDRGSKFWQKKLKGLNTKNELAYFKSNVQSKNNIKILEFSVAKKSQ